MNMPFNNGFGFQNQIQPQQNIPQGNYPQFGMNGNQMFRPFNMPQINDVPQNNNIVWVQGPEGAKAYQMSPNSNLLLMDNDIEGRFYIKTSDNVGMCKLRVFNYSEITDTLNNNYSQVQTHIDYSQFVTKEELQNILENLDSNVNYKKSGGNSDGEQPISTVKSARSSNSK